MPVYRPRLVAGLLLAGCSLLAGAATIVPVSIDRPEGARHYLLAIPTPAPAGKHPLVILLHGHGGTAAQLLGQQRSAAPFAEWLKIADREGLLLAAPDGSRGGDDRPGWNDCRADATGNPHTDDVGLVGATIDREVAEHDADPARIYVMGMSNGGLMTYRLGIELGPRLAAMAAVSASMAAKTLCPPPQAPLSVLVMAGTTDPIMPYGGGQVHFYSAASRGAVLGADQSAAFWRQLDGLPAAPASSATLPHRDPRDPTTVTRTVWGVNPQGLQVELLRIDNGGHVEPSASHRIRWLHKRLVGPQSGDVEAAEEAWTFFRDKRAGLKP